MASNLNPEDVEKRAAVEIEHVDRYSDSGSATALRRLRIKNENSGVGFRSKHHASYTCSATSASCATTARAPAREAACCQPRLFREQEAFTAAGGPCSLHPANSSFDILQEGMAFCTATCIFNYYVQES